MSSSREYQNSRDVREGQTFWTTQQSGYATLCYISNPDDWQAIIAAIAAQVSSAGDMSTSLRIIDVGAGDGGTTFAIMKRLLTTYKRTSTALLVEPSPTARAASRLRFSSSPQSFGTAKAYANLRDMPSDATADVILFIHSTYYIQTLEHELQTLISTHLNSRGMVVFLILSENSPFFLGRYDLWSVNGVVHIDSICQRLGLSVSTCNLTSRIAVHPDLWESDAVVRDWQAFSGYDDWDVPRLRRALRTYLTDGADLRDTLLIARRRWR